MPARSERSGAPEAPRTAPPEGASPSWASWLVTFVVLAAMNLAVRQLDDVQHKLFAYAALMAAALLVSSRLRALLPAAQGVVLLAAAGFVLWAHGGALREGRLSTADAVEEVIYLGTGLGRPNDGALRVGMPSARLFGSIGPFARYVDKVDPRSSEISILAAHLASQCESADHLCETVSILRFVADEVLYRADPRGGEDYVKTPQETLAANAGDCEDKSILLVSLLEALGNRTYLAFTRDHAFPLVCFERSLPMTLHARTGRRGPTARDEYLRRLSPHDEADETLRLVAAAEEIRLDDRSCYAMEPTAPGSFLGVVHESKDFLVAVDPIGRRVVDLAPGLAPAPRAGDTPPAPR